MGSVPWGAPNSKAKTRTAPSSSPQAPNSLWTPPRPLLTPVFLCSWANFSSWAASSFSKSWCLWSSNSTSDTEFWGEAGQGEVQLRVPRASPPPLQPGLGGH